MPRLGLFLPVQGYRHKNSAGPLITVFPEVRFLSQGIFFHGVNCGQLPRRLDFFSSIIFFQVIELSKVKFQGISQTIIPGCIGF